MTDRAETTITLTDAPEDAESAVITNGLSAYNEAQAGVSDSRELAILVRDPKTQNVVGGLLGRTSLGLLRVERFFLPEDLRRDRLGSRILAVAEVEGRAAAVPARRCPQPTFRRRAFIRSRVGRSLRGSSANRPATRAHALLYDHEAVLIKEL